MNKILAAAITAALGFSGIAHAEGLYTGADLQLQQQELKGFGHSETGKVGAINAKLGYEINEYFALEARAGTGLKDGDFFGTNYKLKNSIGTYAIASYPLTDDFSVYGLAGYTKSKYSLGNIDGFSYGVGAKYKLSPVIALTSELGHYGQDKEDGLELDNNALSFGFQYKF